MYFISVFIACSGTIASLKVHIQKILRIIVGESIMTSHIFKPFIKVEEVSQTLCSYVIIGRFLVLTAPKMKVVNEILQ